MVSPGYPKQPSPKLTWPSLFQARRSVSWAQPPGRGFPGRANVSLISLQILRVPNRFGGKRDLAFFRSDIRDMS